MPQHELSSITDVQAAVQRMRAAAAHHGIWVATLVPRLFAIVLAHCDPTSMRDYTIKRATGTHYRALFDVDLYGHSYRFRFNHKAHTIDLMGESKTVLASWSNATQDAELDAFFLKLAAIAQKAAA